MTFTPRFVAIAASSGLFTGVLAGLVGLGGAEERIPFMLYGLRVPVSDMVVSNLVISLGTSGLNFALRTRAGLLPTSTLFVSLWMIAGSALGALIGATVSHRFSERRLKAFLAIVLSIVVLRLTTDLFFGIVPSSTMILPTYSEFPLAAVFGLLIGIISGSIGVAGGEYRIPVLIYAFGLPIKIAGTASQLVSLPTIAVALFRHKNLGFMTRTSLTLAAVMGVPSVAGVALSQLILLGSTDEFIRIVFVVVLLYTIIRILVEIGTGSGNQLTGTRK